VHAQEGEENNLSNSAFPKSGAEKMPRTTKKRKRMDDAFEELSREELIESLLEEQSKNKRLLQQMEQQKGRLEEELRGQRERYEKNEDRLWRMIEEKQ
jgi:gas vesicle protein